MDTEEQTQLCAWLAKRLKRSDVPYPLWASLVDQHYVSEVLDGTADREYLLKKARDIIRSSLEIAPHFGGGLSLPRASKEETFASLDQMQHSNEPSLKDHESGRALAFFDYIAKLAEGNPAVQNFRRRILEVETLTQVQAQNLVSNPALRFLSPTWFLIHHLPILGSQVRILGEERRPHAKLPVQELIVQVELPGGRTETEDITAMSILRPDTLLLPDRSELPGQDIPVWPSSVLGILRNLSAALARHYAWQEEDACWFVLTGEPPMVSPLSWSTRRYGERDFEHWIISLNVAPWISAETLTSYYRYLQRSRLGRDSRRLAERNVAVFRFVVAQLEPQPDKLDTVLERKGAPTSIISRKELSVLDAPSWRTLLEHWNQVHPEWEYTDVRLFYRDFYRAHKAISQPYLR